MSDAEASLCQQKEKHKKHKVADDKSFELGILNYELCAKAHCELSSFELIERNLPIKN